MFFRFFWYAESMKEMVVMMARRPLREVRMIGMKERYSMKARNGVSRAVMKFMSCMVVCEILGV